jgi:hypothetical protein
MTLKENASKDEVNSERVLMWARFFQLHDQKPMLSKEKMILNTREDLPEWEYQEIFNRIDFHQKANEDELMMIAKTLKGTSLYTQMLEELGDWETKLKAMEK